MATADHVRERMRSGRAHLIASGRPVDSSASPDVGRAPASAQQLTNPPAHNPLSDERVAAWVRDRARRELGPA
jgi:hypothetical protein